MKITVEFHSFGLCEGRQEFTGAEAKLLEITLQDALYEFRRCRDVNQGGLSYLCEKYKRLGKAQDIYSPEFDKELKVLKRRLALAEELRNSVRVVGHKFNTDED